MASAYHETRRTGNKQSSGKNPACIVQLIQSAHREIMTMRCAPHVATYRSISAVPGSKRLETLLSILENCAVCFYCDTSPLPNIVSSIMWVSQYIYFSCSIFISCHASSTLQLPTNLPNTSDAYNASFAAPSSNGTQLMLPPVQCTIPLTASIFPSCHQAFQELLHWLMVVEDPVTVGHRGKSNLHRLTSFV